MPKTTLSIQIEMPDELFVDWIVTAIEHGGYGWSNYEDWRKDHKRSNSEEPYSIYVAKRLLQGEALFVKSKHEDGESGYLSAKKFIVEWYNLTKGNKDFHFDIVDVDRIAQLSTLDKYIYA